MHKVVFFTALAISFFLIARLRNAFGNRQTIVRHENPIPPLPPASAHGKAMLRACAWSLTARGRPHSATPDAEDWRIAPPAAGETACD